SGVRTALTLTEPARTCGFRTVHDAALRGLADARRADGARTTAKSKALRIKLRAFMTGSIEYNHQQNDFAIISCKLCLLAIVREEELNGLGNRRMIPNSRSLWVPTSD